MLSIPVLNRGDLLLRCVRSIDWPVNRLLIINNGSDQSVIKALDTIYEELRASPIVTFEYFNARKNLGVAGSWNRALLSAFGNVSEGESNGYLALAEKVLCPYLLLVGSDIEFAQGDLKAFYQTMSGEPFHDIFFGNHGYSLFGLTRKAVGVAGTFDENIYPAYLEDCDHAYRAKLLGLKCRHVEGVAAVHGEAPSWGSSTIHSDPEYRRKNGITHGNNFEYYNRKWGGNNGEEKFRTPFNDPNWPVKRWVFEPEQRAKNDIW